MSRRHESELRSKSFKVRGNHERNRVIDLFVLGEGPAIPALGDSQSLEGTIESTRIISIVSMDHTPKNRGEFRAFRRK